jgi:cytochrome c-type biogenesis protein CcsB
MENQLFSAAYAAYTFSTVLAPAYLFTKREPLSAWSIGLWRAAFGMHLLSLSLRCIHQHHAWSSWFATLSLFAVIVSFLYVVITFTKSIPILGSFVTPIPWVLLSYAWLHRSDLEITSPNLFHTWLSVHIPIAFTAYALLSISFAVGVAYLIQEQQIKSKRPSELAYRLPSLQELDELISSLIVAALPLLLIAAGIGALWAKRTWGRYWAWDPKETWTLITCAFYAVYVYARFARGWRGRKSVYGAMFGFVLVLFTYAGVNYLSPLHQFLSPTHGGQ